MNLGYFETSLDVADIERSLAFYTALGFEPVDGGVEVRTVSLQKGDCRLGLYQGHLDPARTQLIFWQGDVMAAARDLERRGVAFFRGPDQDDNGDAFMLRDPDGHPIYVIHLPVQFFSEPGHARPAEAAPRTATGVGPPFGHFVLGLAAADLERSLAFYARLGFSARGRQARSATMGLGDCAIRLHEGFAEGSAQLTFWQGDLDEIARGLAAQGLVFERGPATEAAEDAGDAILMRDPDGNEIRFTKVQPV
ncbi:MAG: VOC family protein [Proteobacteria bacterium]|nr:VOC family protein [Pseudomonadota bacterium]